MSPGPSSEGSPVRVQLDADDRWTADLAAERRRPGSLATPAGPAGVAVHRLGAVEARFDRVTGRLVGFAVDEDDDDPAAVAAGLDVLAPEGAPARVVDDGVDLTIDPDRLAAWSAIARVEDDEAWGRADTGLAHALLQIDRVRWTVAAHRANLLGPAAIDRAIGTAVAACHRVTETGSRDTVREPRETTPAASVAMVVDEMSRDLQATVPAGPRDEILELLDHVRRSARPFVPVGSAPDVKEVRRWAVDEVTPVGEATRSSSAHRIVVQDGRGDVDDVTAARHGLVPGRSLIVSRTEDGHRLAFRLAQPEAPSPWAVVRDRAGEPQHIGPLLDDDGDVALLVPIDVEIGSIELMAHPARPATGSALTLLREAPERGRAGLVLSQRGQHDAAARAWSGCARRWFALGATEPAGIAWHMGRPAIEPHVPTALGRHRPGALTELLDLTATHLDPRRTARAPLMLWPFAAAIPEED